MSSLAEALAAHRNLTRGEGGVTILESRQCACGARFEDHNEFDLFSDTDARPGWFDNHLADVVRKWQEDRTQEFEAEVARFFRRTRTNQFHAGTWSERSDALARIAAGVLRRMEDR